MKKESNQEDIDLLDLIKLVWSRRLFIIKVVVIVALIGVFFALFSPVMYTTSSLLMPEKQSAQLGSGLIEKFGGLVGLSAGSLSAAESGSIPSSVYPEIVRGSSFMKGIIHEEIQFKEGNLRTTIFDYYMNYYDLSLIEVLKSLPLRSYLAIKSIFISSGDDQIIIEGPYSNVSEDEKEIIEIIHSQISINVDELTGLVSVGVKLQDPIAAAELNRLIRDNLIEVLTNYRLKKAKEELDFVKDELVKAEERYINSQRQLALYVDRNKSLTSESAKIELERLTDQKTLTFNLYNALSQQLEQAKLSLQRETPFFQEIQPITIPIEKSSPRRILIVFISCILGVIIGISFLLVKELIEPTRNAS